MQKTRYIYNNNKKRERKKNWQKEKKRWTRWKKKLGRKSISKKMTKIGSDEKKVEKR